MPHFSRETTQATKKLHMLTSKAFMLRLSGYDLRFFEKTRREKNTKRKQASSVKQMEAAGERRRRRRGK
jgi:hypothetical protein